MLCLAAALLASSATSERELRDSTSSASSASEPRASGLTRGAAAEAPRQLHLAFADERTMAVGWLTHGALPAPPRVRYGTRPGDYTHSATGTTRHDADPAAPFLPFHHDVVLRNLRPDTRYYYAAEGVGGALSAERSFTTLPAPTADGALRCSIFGDMGVNNSAATIARMEQRADHAFIMHVGDVSYADDLVDGRRYEGGRGYEAIYDAFGDMVEPLASSKAYFVAPGNHDVACHILNDRDCLGAHRNFTAYNRRWRMPSPESGGSLNMWYSFNAQRTHFVSIDTETDYDGAPTTPDTRFAGGRGGGFGDQMGWLEQDLQRAHADPAVDWIVVVGHRPIYESIDNAKDWPPDTVTRLREHVEPMFLRYGVDLYIGAHKHYYERLAPLRNRKLCAAGEACPTYIVHGSAGNNEPLSDKGTTHQDWVRASDYSNRGFLEFEVVNATRAAVRFIRADDGLVHDEGWLGQ